MPGIKKLPAWEELTFANNFLFLQNHGGQSLRKQRFPKSAASFACDEMDKNPVASFYGFPRSGKWEPCDQVKT